MPQALLERGQTLLELRGVEKSFGPVRALMGVDLLIESGVVTALVGDNGAGKSTVIKIVSGIETPDGGEDPLARPVGAHPFATGRRRTLGSLPFTRTWPSATTSTSCRTCSSGAR